MTRVLVTGARAPAALHLARLLDGAGHHVVMADSLRYPVGAASRACRAYVRLPQANGPRAAYAAGLQAAISQHQIAMVIPTCEEVLHLAAVWAGFEMKAQLWAPPLAVLQRAHDKFAFVMWAREIGLPVPETQLLTSPADIAALQTAPEMLVFKPVWSRFATKVLVRPKAPAITPHINAPWVAQEYLPGDEICCYAIATHGRITALAAYRPVYRAGHGAGIAFVPVEDPSVTRYVSRFVEASNWTGQVSFDLVRGHDGTVRAIECNPRATSGLHFFRKPDAFADAVFAGQPVMPDVSGPQAVKAALAVYGPFQHPTKVWSDLRRAQDVMEWPGDRRPRWRQWAAFWEMVAVALRHRVSLTTATIVDIAWDGPAASELEPLHERHADPRQDSA